MTLGYKNDARLWNTATGKLIGSWPREPAGSVQAVAFHPDGKTLATGGKDGTVWRWSTSTGLAVGAPLVVGSALRKIEYAAKGRTMMTIAPNSTSLWDAETGRRLADLSTGGQTLFSGPALHRVGGRNYIVGGGAGVSPDGMQVVTKEPLTGVAHLRDAATGRPLGPPCMVEGGPVLLSDDGSLLVTIADNGPHVWDLSTGVERGAYHPFDDVLEVVGRSHDGKMILASLPPAPGPNDTGIQHQGKRAGRYQLVDATSGRPAGEPFTLDGGIESLALGPDGRILVTESLAEEDRSGARGWSRIHDAASGEPLSQRLPGWTSGFSPDGKSVLVGPGTWNVPVTSVNNRLLHSGRSVRQVAFEADGQTVVTLAGPADLCRWDLASGRIVYRLPGREGRSVLGLSSDGRLALVAAGNSARLLRVETGREMGPALDHKRPVTLASFSVDGKMVVTSEGTTFQVWDTSTGRPVGPPRPCHGLIVTLAMGPAGVVYVEESPAPGAESGHRHIVWKEAVSHLLGVLPQKGLGSVAAFTPDGRYLFVGGSQPGGAVAVGAVEAPDGRYLFVGGRRTGRFWDVSEEPPRERPERITSEWAERGVRAVAFVADGRICAVAYEDGTTEVRDVATDRRIGQPRKPDRKAPTAAVPELLQHMLRDSLADFRNTATATALSFSPDGRSLLIGSNDGVTRLWTVPLAIPEHSVSRWLERITAVQLKPDLTLRPLDRDELLDRWAESAEVH